MAVRMLFSIVIPVYNVERYVTECIDSIIGQTYEEWELILVDDGSTDRSHEICEQYVQNNEKIHLFTKENSGQADSRNYGVTKARGEYLIFVDSDDYIGQDTLSEMAQSIQTYGSLDVILSEGTYEVYGEQKIQEKHRWNRKDYPKICGRDALLNTMKVAANWAPWGKCYRLAFWREHEFAFKTKRVSEDFELIDKVVIEAEHVAMVPTFYYYRLFRADSTMTKPNPKLRRDELDNLLDWTRYIEEKHFDEKLTRALRAKHAEMYCHEVLSYMFLFRGAERKEQIRKAKPLVFLLSYADQKDIKIVAKVVKVLGISMTARLLGMVKQYRVKKERNQHS